VVENRNGSQVTGQEESDGRGGKRMRVVVDAMNASSLRPGTQTAASIFGLLGQRQQPRRRGA